MKKKPETVRICECEGPRRLYQGVDRRPQSSGQVLTFCGRCNGLVEEKTDGSEVLPG